MIRYLVPFPAHRSRRTLLAACAAALLALGGCASTGSSPARAVLVAGATGGTGRQLVEAALREGYAVRVLVRDEARARALFGDRVSYATGDVENPATLPAAVRGATYVVSALGAAPNREPNDGPQRIDYRGVAALVEAARAARVRQLVLVSSMGITRHDHFLNKMYNNQLIWKGKGEDALRASGVPYTIVRPGNLRDEPGGQQGLRTLQGDPPVSGRVTRADVATVCIAAFGRKAALGKTFELLNDGAAAAVDWDAFYGVLTADTR